MKFFKAIQGLISWPLTSNHPQEILDVIGSIPFLFTGNKCDMETLREVEFEEAEALSQTVPGILAVMEVSAKDNTNVDDTFLQLATELKVRKKYK